MPRHQDSTRLSSTAAAVLAAPMSESCKDANLTSSRNGSEPLTPAAKNTRTEKNTSPSPSDRIRGRIAVGSRTSNASPFQRLLLTNRDQAGNKELSPDDAGPDCSCSGSVNVISKLPARRFIKTALDPVTSVAVHPRKVRAYADQCSKRTARRCQSSLLSVSV